MFVTYSWISRYWSWISIFLRVCVCVYTHMEKSEDVTEKLIFVTAKHLAGNDQVNVRRSLNQLKWMSFTNLTVSAISFVWLHWEKNAIESIEFLLKACLWFKSKCYRIGSICIISYRKFFWINNIHDFGRNATDIIAFFSQCTIRTFIRTLSSKVSKLIQLKKK